MTLAEQQRPARRPKYDQRLLASLAAGKRYREAAKKAGCSYLTVTRRMADPLFGRSWTT
jgi:transposase